MAISMVDHQLPHDTHNRYDVAFFDHRIRTLLTRSPNLVSSWLSQLPRPPLLVGLDVEWRPNFYGSDFPVAIIQLCTASSSSSSTTPGPSATCLIFQIFHATHAPQQLVDFLANPANTFVGVKIAEDAEKLQLDHSLSVGKAVDLRSLAGKELKNAGLKRLAKEVLGKEVEKPKEVSRSLWDEARLTPAQVQYACIDAFLSFEIGRSLTASASASSAAAAAAAAAGGRGGGGNCNYREFLFILFIYIYIMYWANKKE